MAQGVVTYSSGVEYGSRPGFAAVTYETRKHPLLPRLYFIRRMSLHFAAALGVVCVSLLIGMTGYVRLERLSWLDAFLNAAMLLGGMGPVESPQTPGGKLFAGVFALYAGLVFLVVASLVLAPVIHRILHKFHLQAGD